MIFYVPSLNRSFWISEEVVQRMRENAKRVIREALKRRKRIELFRRIGLPEDLIQSLTRRKT